MSAREDHGDQPIILLIENDDTDVFLFRRALGKLDYSGRVHAVATLTEARAFLQNTDRFSDRLYYRRPDLIVSDFRLVGETALDLLSWLRLQPEMVSLRLLILTGATTDEYAVFEGLGVETILAKTHDCAELGAMLRPLLP